MRELYRKKLHKFLGSSGDEEFIQLLWSTHILQSDSADAARKYFKNETVPAGAITTDMLSPFFIHKWEIETLANELMTVHKLKQRKGATRTLRWDSFEAAAQCVRYLRKLENSEYRVQKKSEDISIEMGRIAARQFDWQRGYLNIPQFYRNAYVYGQGECAAYFERQYGITINRFSLIGFLLYVIFTKFPVVGDNFSCVELGVTHNELACALRLIALPFPEASMLAKEKRSRIIHTSDKPSVLRQSPCLRFGENGMRIRSPLPELILERVTSGIFYDVVSGGGLVRDDYGKRFEEYCSRYLSDTLPGFAWEREFKYQKNKKTFDTPDIIGIEAGRFNIAIECKATRMSHEAMFGKDPTAARGYEDLTKAVYQLWRFFSHCRRGYVKREVTQDAIGVVLTLDNWLVMAETIQKRVLEGAAKMAAEKEPEIAECDRKSIVFVAVPELEKILLTATEETFKSSLVQANSEEFRGWRLDGVHRKLLEDNTVAKREYPYAEELGILLPWWLENKQRWQAKNGAM